MVKVRSISLPGSGSKPIIWLAVNKIVRIYDRKGAIVDSIPLPGACTGLDWDYSGRTLAVTQEDSGVVFLWDAQLRKTSQLDSNMKGISFCRWSPKSSSGSSDVLAIGTNKGNLMLYNRATSRKLPLLGKHTKAVIDGCWLDANLLLCLSEDKTLSLSNLEGDTMEVISVGADPTLLRVSEGKSKGGRKRRYTSVVVSGKSLLIHDADREAPMELSFQSKYGSIVGYEWLQKDLFLLGFSNGYVIAMSAGADIGKELVHMRDFKEGMSDIVFCLSSDKVAMCGEDTIKVHDLGDLKNVNASVTLEAERGSLDKFQWSEDGQFLTVFTKSGSLYTFLTKIPQLADVFLDQMCVLSSLSEISILPRTILGDQQEEAKPYDLDVARKVIVPVEVHRLAMGGMHFAVAYNNKVFVYALEEGNPLVAEKEMRSPIMGLKLNRTHVALLAEGSIHIFQLMQDKETFGNHPATLVITGNPETFQISTFAFTPDFVIVGTAQGALQHFVLDEKKSATDYRHPAAIKELSVNDRGTRVTFLDADGKCFLWNPVDDHSVPIPNPPATIKSMLWKSDPNFQHGQFIVCSNETVHLYVEVPSAISGDPIFYIGSCSYPAGMKPLSVHQDTLICMNNTGKLMSFRLNLNAPTNGQEETLLSLYLQEKWNSFWEQIRAPETASAILHMIAEQCFKFLDLISAEQIYRHLGDSSMVLTIKNLRQEEDRIFLCGQVFILLGDFNLAQEHFLASNHPKAALDMRCDLMQWDQALSLAARLAPEEIPYISLQYAQQLETRGNHRESLDMYNRSWTAYESHFASKGATDVLKKLCFGIKAGLARETLRSGDIPRGMRFLQELEDKSVTQQCAVILETTKHLLEAAVVYEKAESYEKAAELYIKIKNYGKVGELLAKVQTPKIHGQYARAKEAEGNHTEAATGYLRANDNENLVRVYVDHLRNIDEAVKIVRETKSMEGAKLVTRYFQSIKDYRSVVEFCLLAGMQEEALNYAKVNNQMELYAELVEKEASMETLTNLAGFFEQTNQLYLAGKYYGKAGDTSRSLQLFLRSGEERGMDAAVELVGATRSETMQKQLIDFLTGSQEGQNKNSKLMFKLHLASGNYAEAARAAVVLSQEEQAAGNYRQAHQLLFTCCQKFTKEHMKVPMELDRTLAVLHSYILVKVIIRMEDHVLAAKLLKRVANNISKFPNHVVPILTSTVIECYRSGMKQSAFEFASILCRPEYRPQVDAKYKRKIELIVRRREDEELLEKLSPCPFCNEPLSEMTLDCSACRNPIPFCIASCAHIVEQDFCTCPHCNFPAIYSQMCKILAVTGGCPMCENHLKPEQLKQTNAQQYLRASIPSVTAKNDVTIGSVHFSVPSHPQRTTVALPSKSNDSSMSDLLLPESASQVAISQGENLELPKKGRSRDALQSSAAFLGQTIKSKDTLGSAASKTLFPGISR